MTKEGFVNKWRNRSSFGTEEYNKCLEDLNVLIDSVLQQADVKKSVCDHDVRNFKDRQVCEKCGEAWIRQ